jgi:tetratricopeptide (TPR) repeat protein
VARYFIGITVREAGDFDEAMGHLEAALGLMRDARSATGIAMCLGSIGSLAFRQGDLVRAETLGREALALDYACRDRYAVSEQLIDLALVMAARGGEIGAVRLYAAAHALRQHHGVPTPTFDRDRDARFLQFLRQSQGDVTFTEAWNAGSALPIEAVVAEALGGEDPSLQPAT